MEEDNPTAGMRNSMYKPRDKRPLQTLPMDALGALLERPCTPQGVQGEDPARSPGLYCPQVKMTPSGSSRRSTSRWALNTSELRCPLSLSPGTHTGWTRGTCVPHRQAPGGAQHRCSALHPAEAP